MRALKRRTVIAGMAAAALPWSRAKAGAGRGVARFLTARAGAGATYAASLLTAAGDVIADIPLQARGHGAAVRPDGSEAVLFARRPGDFALVVDIADGRVVRRLEPPAGRRFAGHGAYSQDGARLYVVAFKEATAEGVVLIHDVAVGFRPVGEFPTGGIGPHQTLLLPDGERLVVCNGGIRTHPDYPRAKLNIPTMHSSLSLIEAASGHIERTLTLKDLDHRLSLRHIDAAADGRIVVGMQFEGPRDRGVPLAALYRPGGGLKALDMPADALGGLRQYVGSIAFDSSGAWIAATSPRGGAIAIWHAADGAYRGSLKLPDVCGIAAASRPGGFIVTSGRGVVAEADATAMTLRQRGAPRAGMRWDNHLIAIKPA
jgi:hypothetical protein